MAGIYLHIPFCRKACHYCDFHFSTHINNKSALLESIIKEIKEKDSFFKDQSIESIYFGGGTPSVLSISEIEEILNTIEVTFKINRDSLSEITFEANPDDLSLDYLSGLKELGINRLSIGIQSLNDSILKFLNRSHNRDQAYMSVQNALDLGFQNISLDFIYGIKQRDEKDLIQELEFISQSGINHLSVYALTIEEKTVFGNWKSKGQELEMQEDLFEREYFTMTNYLSEKHFEQYEISNFAKDKRYALHNTNYWFNKKYLGIGPSAHSFDGDKRIINPSNNALYIKGVNSGSIKREIDDLEDKDHFNEHIMTRLRTIWGIDQGYLKSNFSNFYDIIQAELNDLINKEYLIVSNNTIILNPKYRLLVDEISSKLFVL